MRTNICIFEALNSYGICWPAQYKYLAFCVFHNAENPFNRRCASPYVNACIFLNCQPLLSINGLYKVLVLSYRTTGEKASKVTKFKTEGSEPSLEEEKWPSEIASIL